MSTHATGPSTTAPRPRPRSKRHVKAALLDAIVESSDDAIISKTLDGDVTSWNDGAERMYGYTADEIIGKPVAVLIPSDRSNEMDEILEKIRAGERINHYETMRCTKDGRTIAVSLTVSPIYDGYGVTIGASSIARDISDRQHADEALRSAAQYARSLIEASLDPLVTISLDGKITDVNEATVRVTGVARQQLIGTDFPDYFTEPDKAREGYGQVFADGLVTDYPLTIRNTSGGLTDVLYNASVYRDADDNVSGVFAAARDVTERKKVTRLQEDIVCRLGALDAAKTDFVARVSHELRTPLTSVLGYLEVLEEGEVGALNDDQRRILEVVDRNGRRLLSLVEDLLTMGRAEAGGLRMRTSRFPLVTIVDWVVQSLGSGIEKRELTCTVSVEPGLELDGDADQLERMLTSLVSNSIKFTPPGGQVGISAWTDDGQAVVSVRDTGIGVPVDEQPMLFTRFFRSSISELFETQGTGLGLFIVKQIVEAHGGVATAASTPGEGTTITVRLPLRQA